LFNPSSPVSGIQVGNRSLTEVPNNGNAKIFSGASEAEIKDYFLQLTGSNQMPVPRTIVIGGQSTTLYNIQTPNGSFNLRNNSTSEITGYGKPDWTIEVPSGFAKPTSSAEIKFINSGGKP
jgi:hypothetical protein